MTETVMIWLGCYLATPIDLSMLRCLYGFFCGVISFMAFRKIGARARRLPIRTASALEIVSLFACFALVWEVYGAAWPTMLAPLLFGLTIFFLAARRGALSALLSSWPFRWLGDLSYAIYMMHIPLLNIYTSAVTATAAHGIVPSHWNATALLPLYAALLIGLSSVSFDYFEIPLRKRFASYARGFAVGRVLEYEMAKV